MSSAGQVVSTGRHFPFLCLRCRVSQPVGLVLQLRFTNATSASRCWLGTRSERRPLLWFQVESRLCSSASLQIRRALTTIHRVEPSNAQSFPQRKGLIGIQEEDFRWSPNAVRCCPFRSEDFLLVAAYLSTQPPLLHRNLQHQHRSLFCWTSERHSPDLHSAAEAAAASTSARVD